VTTTRRGWRAALDSSLLFAVVVCGSVMLLTATPAAAVVAGRTNAVASHAPESEVVESQAVAPFESNAWVTDTRESTPRDSAEEDDDSDDDDDDVLEHSLSHILARGLETWLLTRTDRNPSISLESDGHSLRAPPQ
jgi:hypothetical protein